MSLSYTRKIAVVAMAVALTACNRNQTQTPPAPAPPAPVVSAPAPPAAPAPIPASTELPVNTVDSVMLSRPQDDPMTIVIRVAGTVPSGGWINAKLAEDPDSSGDATVKTYKFVATSPEMPEESRAPQQIEAEIRIAAVPADVKTIRIVSAMNEISAPVAQ